MWYIRQSFPSDWSRGLFLLSRSTRVPPNMSLVFRKEVTNRDLVHLINDPASGRQVVSINRQIYHTKKQLEEYLATLP